MNKAIVHTFIRQCREPFPKNLPQGRGLRPAVFFDRDGTLIEERHYLQNLLDLQLFPDTIASLKKLNQANLPLYIITNQAGIAHGYFTVPTLQAIHGELIRQFQQAAIAIHGIFYCPHHPEAELAEYRRDCFGRKPHPGLLYQAADQEQLDLSRSYVVGDQLSDIGAGKQVGANTALVLTGHGSTAVSRLSPATRPTFTGANLTAVTDWLLADFTSQFDQTIQYHYK
jgi:D-glycero-D-manno-heptose 1,7-bisphosphate phosphatase